MESAMDHKPQPGDRVEAVFSIAALLIIALLLIAWLVADRTDPVISFDEASVMVIADASPGEWVDMEIPVIKYRDCVLQAGEGGPILYYSDGSEASVDLWVRNGPLLNPEPDVWQRGAIKFKIPVDAPVGVSAVIFRAVFQCAFGRVEHESPAKEFTILR